METSYKMTSQTTLSVALLAALSTNILLLIILLVKSSNVPLYNKCPKPKQVTLGCSSGSEDNVSGPTNVQNTLDNVGLINEFSETTERLHMVPNHAGDHQDYTNDNLVLLRLLQKQLLHSERSPMKEWNRDNFKASDSSEESDDVKFKSSWTYEKQPFPTVDRAQSKDLRSRPIFDERNLPTTARTPDIASSTRATNEEAKSRNNSGLPEVNDYFAKSDLHDHSSPMNLSHLGPSHWIVVGRDRREAVSPSTKDVASGEWMHKAHKVFSSLTDSELARFDSAVYDLLIPALIHMETMIIREFDSLQSIVVAHDLRLENMEQSMLKLKDQNPEQQSDSSDNKSEPDSPSHILGGKDGLLPVGNGSGILELPLDVDGSGDVQWATTQTPSPQPTHVHNAVVFYDMYRILGTLEQKVMSLENYNVMSDSELTRVRSEVIKLDDKVTELDRQQRNLQIRTSMHTQKITELEVYMSKSELGIMTGLDSYSRVSSRLDAFKDKLTEFKNDLQTVTVQFGRHDQIANELRAADSYKAHDIQEMRKSMFNIEGRLNGLYRLLDHNLDTVRTDLRAMLDRLCTNNKLAC